MMTRRHLLRNLALASLGLQLGLPRVDAASGKSDQGGSRRETRLVVIHLFGGNDGLNTIVSPTDPMYRRLRPRLALPASACLEAGQGLFFHPALAPLLPLWQRGHLAVVNGVGYPHPNHSHFISSDIWHGGGPDQSLGWLGRAADLADLKTMQMARSDQARALWAHKRQPLCLDPEQSPSPMALDPMLEQLYADHGDSHLRSTFSNMRRLEARIQACRCPGEGQKAADLRRSLGWVLELLPEARVFHTTMSGFDTHSEQGHRHHQALEQLAGALAELWQGLEDRGWADSTAVMVFSEFGRRVEENRSLGTDHGTAGPLLLLGRGVRGGWWGQFPDLGQLDQGDLRYLVDFRQVYAGILEAWLEIDSEKILGQHYDALRCFR